MVKLVLLMEIIIRELVTEINKKKKKIKIKIKINTRSTSGLAIKVIL